MHGGTRLLLNPTAALLTPCCGPAGAGTGKSAVTRVIVQRLVAAGKRVLVTATSATAASRLHFSGSDTIDATVQLSPGRKPTALNPYQVTTYALKMADVVVVDELSMLDSAKLAAILSAMSQSTAIGTPQKMLLLVGDLWQVGMAMHGGCARAKVAHNWMTRCWLCCA